MSNTVERPPKIMSILTVLVTMSAWLAISNHCALGAVAPEAKPSPDQCPFHAKKSAPAKQKESSSLPCCKILRATVASTAKNFAKPIVDLPPLVFTKLIVLAPPKISFHSSTLDTGPPGETSVAELIESSPWRAPPALA